ncbi:type II toxin-antitoxin system VapC family toxin [Sorangium sp. So ce1335]|uniref:type II toxin-antitoxin system VapC family toxin n=1 Tax=Sorangium sp. So ce1335 TaxID=3133335 RepID=UPI003F62141E
MTLRFLLDTNTVSAPVASKPSPEIVRRLEQHGHECAIGAPVWHELEYGYRRLPRGRRRTALEAYIEEVVRASFPILPYDEAAAAWHGAERARLEEHGLAAPHVDGQIAAIAHANGLVLVTANTKDFARFKDIEIEDWSRRRAR